MLEKTKRMTLLTLACLTGGLEEATADTFTSPASPVATQANQTVSVDVVVPATQSVTIRDVNVTIDIKHTFLSDLRIFLKHNGTTVLICNRVGAQGGNTFYDIDDFHFTTLDDEAPMNLDGVDFTNDLLMQSYQPDNPLSAFDGTSSGGTWTLDVFDIDEGIGNVTGIINCFSITFNGESRTKDLGSTGQIAVPGLGQQTVSTLDFPDLGFPLADVELSLDLVHPRMQFLSIELISPSGTIVPVLDGGTLSPVATGLFCTTLDQEAALPLASGFPFHTGRFQPSTAPSVAFDLSDLAGESFAGTWSLVVTNNWTTEGTLRGWWLNIEPECLLDTDGDGTSDCYDACPSDPNKSDPGTCGCGVSDADSDGDGIVDCLDNCPLDPFKTDPGTCGCGFDDTLDSDGDGTVDCFDNCPLDPLKTAPGTCGCGFDDTLDSDGDGIVDCLDACPNDPDPLGPCGCDPPDSDGDGVPDCIDNCPGNPDLTFPGPCGCDTTDSDGDGLLDCLDACPDNPDLTSPGPCGCDTTDSDRDGTLDCLDACPLDPDKTEPGTCGCGTPDVDSDGDGTPDCDDACPNDPDKTDPGACGCGTPDVDSDGDGTLDCNDGCPNDPDKTDPGACGCGTPDVDSDGDGTPDCNDGCPSDSDKTDPGTCGCGTPDDDSDGDGTPDCLDECPNNPDATFAGPCGCDFTDSDDDGLLDCLDGCPDNPDLTAPGPCGCDSSDSDGDGTLDCVDGCPSDPDKVSPGACGCGISESDSDGDLVPDCIDICPDNVDPGQADFDSDGIGDGCDNCPDLANPMQGDCDEDGIGDACEIQAGAPDVDQNGIPDECQFTSHCNGDGGNQQGCTNCPCGNNSAPGTQGGCLNSVGTAARLIGMNTMSISSADLRFEASGLPPQATAILVSGDAIAPQNGANPCFGLSSGIKSVSHDGLRCVVQNIRRHGNRQSDLNGNIGLTNGGWGTPDGFFGLGGFTAGQTKHFQIYHRDAVDSVCPVGTGLNTSQAVTVTFGS